MRKSLIALAGSATLVAATVFSAGAATAATSPGTPRTLAGHLFTPLSLDVRSNGTVYVSQNFAGVLTKVTKTGKTKTLAATSGDELGAVSHRGNVLYYATTSEAPGATLWKLKLNGKSKPKAVADLYAYEKKRNPDGATRYGFIGLPSACAAQFPAEQPASYKGIVESHPYASLTTKKNVYVADAAANAIFKVNRKTHKIKTVAVLPAAKPITITADVAAAQGLPSCVAGYKYRFEGVPTDLEFGPRGQLYVTSLPGGPEDPSLGARGSVIKINPVTGKTKRVASGFVGTTGLAVAGNGTIYVAELFGGKKATGRISVVRPGKSTPKKFLAVSAPSAIEIHKNKLYVTTDSFVPDSEGTPQPIGKVTIVPLKK